MTRWKMPKCCFNTHASQNMMCNIYNHGYFGYFIPNPFNVSDGELRVICVMWLIESVNIGRGLNTMILLIIENDHKVEME